MNRLLTILFICIFCTGTVYAQEKQSKKNKSDKLSTTSITSVNTIQTQKIKAIQNNLDNSNKLINTGYQLQKAKDMIGSVSSVNTSQIKNGAYSNIFSYLQARVSGLSVSSDPTNPSGYSIRINGVNTMGNSDPLVVVNGTPTNGLGALSSLNPNDVKSVSVLKGAASTSLYGFQGANGVIVITTK